MRLLPLLRLRLGFLGLGLENDLGVFTFQTCERMIGLWPVWRWTMDVAEVDDRFVPPYYRLTNAREIYPK